MHLTGPEPDGLPLRRRDGTLRDDTPSTLPAPRSAAHSLPRQATARRIPHDPPDPAPRRIPAAPRNPNRAAALRNGLQAIWHQLIHTAPWYAGASAVAWLLTRALTGSTGWAWAAATVPMLVFVGWMWLVIGQARDHYRGDALPPPGSRRVF